MLRVGLYGGAFDPPHLAHQALARAALQQLGLDRLHIVPTGDAWHKPRSLSPARHRLVLCQLAFGDCPGVCVDERELQRNGPSYTVDTLVELQQQYPQARLYLIIGSDQAQDFGSWHRAQDILRRATVVVAQRADPEGHVPKAAELAQPQTLLPAARGVDQAQVLSLALRPMPHSASQVRARVAAGEDIAALVPAAVARYIAAHRLYSANRAIQ